MFRARRLQFHAAASVLAFAMLGAVLLLPALALAAGGDDAATQGYSRTATDHAAAALDTEFAAEADRGPGPKLTIDQLRARASVLQRERDDLSGRVLELELARQVAEDGYDVALLRYSEHLVEIYKQGDVSRMTLLLAARDASDAVVRAQVVAQLAAHDRSVVGEFERAADGIAQAATRTERLERRLGATQERLDGMLVRIDNYEQASGPVRPEKFSIDSNLIFETSPGGLVGLGGFGAAAGLGGTGALAALGAAAAGDGSCEPPQAGMTGTGQTEYGEASWYGPGFDGNNTASGETYDQFALTAAHKTLPMGTIVRVTAANGRCAFVRINDRGPFVAGRIIDLSLGAAQRLDIDGVMDVQVEVWQ